MLPKTLNNTEISCACESFLHFPPTTSWHLYSNVTSVYYKCIWVHTAHARAQTFLPTQRKPAGTERGLLSLKKKEGKQNNKTYHSSN